MGDSPVGKNDLDSKRTPEYRGTREIPWESTRTIS